MKVRAKKYALWWHDVIRNAWIIFHGKSRKRAKRNEERTVMKQVFLRRRCERLIMATAYIGSVTPSFGRISVQGSFEKLKYHDEGIQSESTPTQEQTLVGTDQRSDGVEATPR